MDQGPATSRSRAGLALAIALAAATGAIVVAVPPGDPFAAPPPAAVGPLEIGPVDGLTTVWHPAPIHTAIPLGTMATFRVQVPSDATVGWIGAIEVARMNDMSLAVCPLEAAGPQVVKVGIVAGGAGYLRRCELDVVDTIETPVTVSGVEVAASGVDIDPALPLDELNALTLDLYFGPSIAEVRQVDENQYRTSINRPFQIEALVEPAGFAPLMEWSVDGVVESLGPTYAAQLWDVGTRQVAVGPPGAAQAIEIETYRVTITGKSPGLPVFDGVPVTYTAVTDPPGYEQEITWLAATKFGSAAPLLGSGPTFQTVFQDTFGPASDDGTSAQWLGAKAGDAALGQDQKSLTIALCQGTECDSTIDWCDWCTEELAGDCAGVPLEVGMPFCTYPCQLTGQCLSSTVFQVLGTHCFVQAIPIGDGCDNCPLGSGSKWIIQ